MTETSPVHKDVQHIYDDDHSPDLLRLFLDPTMTYSCAYFERDDMSLEEAQYAKLDLALGKCDLQHGLTLLDIGCGYGECAKRAASRYGVSVIGLTPSIEQAKIAAAKNSNLPEGSGIVEIRNQGWEQCHTPVDRIVSIGAFEHFRKSNFAGFFERSFELLPTGGTMLLHTIVLYNWENLKKRGIDISFDNLMFFKFIAKEIFPGGQLADPEYIRKHAEQAGFSVQREHFLGLHYARTLETWAENLEKKRDEAIALKGAAVYDRYMKYLIGCAEHFRSGHVDLCQFTLRAG